MNKKIYFNSKFIALTDKAGAAGNPSQLSTYTYSNETDLQQLVQSFLNASDQRSVQLIVAGNSEKVFEELKKNFAYIEAAGGFIERNSEYLFIHRHGRWDLPKGKLEKKETIEHAAVRECEEECGVRDLHIISRLPSTFHIYPYKSGYALKQTFWFYMQTDYAQALSPQLEEDIDQVKWFSKNDILSLVLKDTYYTISDTIKEALKL